MCPFIPFGGTTYTNTFYIKQHDRNNRKRLDMVDGIHNGLDILISPIAIAHRLIKNKEKIKVFFRYCNPIKEISNLTRQGSFVFTKLGNMFTKPLV